MGIFSRFSDIVNSNLHAILDKAEDPEKMVRLIIQEMEDTLVEVRSTAARAIADRKTLERRLAVLEADAEDWEAKAELAVKRGRDDLARAALVEKAAIEEQLEVLQRERNELQENLEHLEEDITRLQAKLNDARARQRSLVQRQRAASQRVAVRRKVHDRRLGDALSRFEAYEERLDRLESEAESLDIGRSATGLRGAFQDLEGGEKVSRELDALKARLRGQEPPRSGSGGSGTV